MTNRETLARIQNIKVLSFIGLMSLIVFIIFTVENLLTTAVLAFVLSYLLTPIVLLCERARLSKKLATIIAFLLFTLTIITLFYFLLPPVTKQISNLHTDLPRYISGFKSMVSQFETMMIPYTGESFSMNLSTRVESLILASAKAIFEETPNWLSQSITVLLLAPFFAFFLIADGPRMKTAILKMVPNKYFELIHSLQHKINEQLSLFVLARFLEATLVGLVVWVGLSIAQFPFTTLLAIFAALTNLVPYVGPLVGMMPPLVIALSNGMDSIFILIILGIYITAQLLDVFIIVPAVIAKIVNLHPITVVVAILIGAQWLGILGMLISIPIANALKVTTQTFYNHFIQTP